MWMAVPMRKRCQSGRVGFQILVRARGKMVAISLEWFQLYLRSTGMGSNRGYPRLLMNEAAEGVKDKTNKIPVSLRSKPRRSLRRHSLSDSNVIQGLGDPDLLDLLVLVDGGQFQPGACAEIPTDSTEVGKEIPEVFQAINDKVES